MTLEKTIKYISDTLKKTIIGQDHVVDAILPYLKVAYYDLNPNNTRPICSVFLAGPPATGKTFFVETLSKAIHKTPHPNLIKINCTEMQQDHEIARLIGAPPGYIGHRETKPLLNFSALKRLETQNSNIKIILFDEIEKAAPALFKILLNIMESGELIGGDGIKTTFNNCMIFFTSNLGSMEMTKLAEHRNIGFQPGNEVNTSKFSSFIKKQLLPEFFSRLDDIIIFNFLTKKQKEQVVINQLQALKLELEERKKVYIKYKNIKELVKWVLKNCEDVNSNYDLRNIRRIIYTKLLSEMIDEIVDKPDHLFEVDIKCNKIVTRFMNVA
jgi:ATP-dependent Clp protease ATP-binding subunit ClpA